MSPSVEERLAVLEERTASLPHINQRVDEIWAWVNQQKGSQQLGKYIIPGVALLVSIAAFLTR